MRASYGLFGSQLGTGTVQSFSAASQALLIYSATDRNGNNVADPDELETLQNFAGVDPANPAPASTSIASIPTSRRRRRTSSSSASIAS